MRFTPHYTETRGNSRPHLNPEPSDLTDAKLHVSGSHWGLSHLYALRVVLLESLPIERIIPAAYVPTPGSHDFIDLEQRIKRATLADLKQFYPVGRTIEAEGNPFYALFKAISDTIMTRPAHVEGTASYARTPDSQSSSESNEDKDEEFTRVTFTHLINPVLNHSNFPAISTNDYHYHLSSSTGPQKVRIWLGDGAPVTAKNDGSLFFIRSGRNTGSGRFGVVPAASFEAKRRDAAGIHVKSGEQEGYCASVLGQEVAELLGQAMEQSKEVSPNTWVDQEGFVVSVHGTKLKITAAHFSAEYLSSVNSKIMPVSQVLWVRRTAPLDLRDVDDRVEALHWIIGLVAYMYSGGAEIGLLQKILS